MTMSARRPCRAADPRTVRSPSTGAAEDRSSALFPAGDPRQSLCGATPVGGLRMVQRFEHEPVMVEEVVALFGPVPSGVVVDGTIGGGGHAAALLDAHPHLGLLGLDRDPDAVDAATSRLARFGPRAAVRHARFKDLEAEVRAARAVGGPSWPAPPLANSAEDAAPLSGVLLDLGVSSPQLDRAERGFSYRSEGPLDMRMDPTAGTDALALVNEADVGELTRLFAANGEGRLAGRIARAIVAARPVTTTAELAEVVAAAVPAALRRRGHPARRVFQALRVAVNEELDELAAALPSALDLLAVGGRAVVISYHSGEDRLVKQALAEAATGGCTCPPGLPCVCGASPRHRLVFRGSRRPSAQEVARNHRAESARLRAAERTELAP
jgi:16S rRNA (cytosine1402-N4)-methyltransferase